MEEPDPGRDLTSELQAAKAELARVFAVWEAANDAEREARGMVGLARFALGDAERRLRGAGEPPPAQEDIYERARRLRGQQP